MARLPPGDRGGRLRDRRDRQDRRPLLLLHAPQAHARLHAGLAADVRRGHGQHQHRSRRLRREGDGPPRPRAGPRRTRLPSREPEAAEEPRHHQRLRPCREVAVVPDLARQPGHRAAADALAPGRARTQHRRRAGRGHRQPDARTARDPRRGARPRLAAHPLRRDGHARGAGRLWHRDPEAAHLRADALGLLGAEPRPRHPIGQGVGEGDPRQDGRHHRCVVGHRQGHGAARGGPRRHRDPRGARSREAGADEGRHHRPGRRGGARTRATCPTSRTSTSWPRS